MVEDEEVRVDAGASDEGKGVEDGEDVGVGMGWSQKNWVKSEQALRLRKIGRRDELEDCTSDM